LISEWSAFHALRSEEISPPERARGAVEVETVTLDGFASESEAGPPDVVKIDVEGAELEVIKGMAALLASKRPLLICELHGTNAEFVGLIESSGPEPYAFTAATAVRLRRMLRLRRDLHVNFHGAAIIMDLVERLDGLERELARRGPEPPSTPNLEVTEIWIRTD